METKIFVHQFVLVLNKSLLCFVSDKAFTYKYGSDSDRYTIIARVENWRERDVMTRYVTSHHCHSTVHRDPCFVRAQVLPQRCQFVFTV